MYKPIRPVAKPKYTASENVTVVVPTIDCGPEILIALESWMKSNPKQVIFVTIPEMQASLKLLTRKIDPIGKTVKVITVPKGNKRNQMVAGINQVETAITIFCDDDVQWPDNFINHCIAPFEDDDMGGVGTSQRAIAQGKWFSIWEIMASFRVSMRNVEITASTFIDGGVVCLSGRTAAYRTVITN